MLSIKTSSPISLPALLCCICLNFFISTWIILYICVFYLFTVSLRALECKLCEGRHFVSYIHSFPQCLKHSIQHFVDGWMNEFQILYLSLAELKLYNFMHFRKGLEHTPGLWGFFLLCQIKLKMTFPITIIKFTLCIYVHNYRGDRNH